MCCTNARSLLSLPPPHINTRRLHAHWQCSTQTRRRSWLQTHTDHGKSCQTPHLPPEWSPSPLGLICLLLALWLLCHTCTPTHTGTWWFRLLVTSLLCVTAWQFRSVYLFSKILIQSPGWRVQLALSRHSDWTELAVHQSFTSKLSSQLRHDERREQLLRKKLNQTGKPFGQHCRQNWGD